MIDESIMRFEEKAIFNLRSLYKKYGYVPYKMSKFEEYELYIRNKNFLVSDRVISFNDTNGKLMALKPDVTLSIIKNGNDDTGLKQKVFYNENVYRISDSTHRFKEIMQTGLECIGDIDIYDIYEVISLASESLATISDDFYLEINNMDIVYSVIATACDDRNFIKEAMLYVSEKNPHDLIKLCDKYDVTDENKDKLTKLVLLHGERKFVMSQITEISDTKEVNKLKLLSDMLDKSVFGDKIKWNFSVVNDMGYYNGFVFKGYISGICFGVLAGGQYDNMMKKMNRNAGAIGFALYLDRLDGLNTEKNMYDVDYLLLYDNTTVPSEISSTVSRLIATGATVNAQKAIPKNLKYKKIIDLRKKD